MPEYAPLAGIGAAHTGRSRSAAATLRAGGCLRNSCSPRRFGHRCHPPCWLPLPVVLHRPRVPCTCRHPYRNRRWKRPACPRPAVATRPHSRRERAWRSDGDRRHNWSRFHRSLPTRSVSRLTTCGRALCLLTTSASVPSLKRYSWYSLLPGLSFASSRGLLRGEREFLDSRVRRGSALSASARSALRRHFLRCAAAWPRGCAKSADAVPVYVPPRQGADCFRRRAGRSAARRRVVLALDAAGRVGAVAGFSHAARPVHMPTSVP